MDSTAQRTHVGFEIINKNLVAAESEIINETASMGDAWIRHSKEPMWPQKSSTKVVPRVTHGFDSANSPAASEIFIETASTGDTWIRQRKQPLRPPKSSPKTLAEVTHAFDSANNHTTSEIFNKTASTGDAWIRQQQQHLRPQKSSTKLLPRVMHGFDSAKGPCGLRNHQRKLSPCRIRNLQQNCFHEGRMDSTAQTAHAGYEVINETASTGDAWIRQRKQPLRPPKSSSKVLPRGTRGFDSANSPCGLKNIHRNCW